jgi:choline dehydrogenase
MGGGSAVNAMAWVRGHASDFDEWENLGAEGWNGEAMLPYFIRSETFHGPLSAWRGGDGPQSVSLSRCEQPLTDNFVRAARRAGHPHNPDYNGADQIGVGDIQVSQRRGWRSTTASAFIEGRWRGRSNLRVETGVTVTRIIVEDGVATGVEFLRDGQVGRIRVSDEVVLCAGAMASPRLLMLSGIGPVEELEDHSITPVHELPGVGANLQEHPFLRMKFRVNQPTMNVGITAGAVVRHGWDYMVHGGGPASSPLAHAVLFARLDGSGHPRPDTQMFFAPFQVLTPDSSGSGVNSAKLSDIASVMAFACVLHPRSRGRVRIGSTDPMGLAQVEHELLGDPEDLAAVIRAVREIRRIFTMPSLASVTEEELHPGPQVQDDAQWEQFIRDNSVRGQHPAGTCRMGEDDLAVVDSRLRVRGIRGLRVADASVMPTLTSGNTNAPVIAIAERAADFMTQAPAGAGRLRAGQEATR